MIRKDKYDAEKTNKDSLERGSAKFTHKSFKICVYRNYLFISFVKEFKKAHVPEIVKKSINNGS